MLLRPVLLRHCFHSPSPAPPPIYLAPALASPTGPSLVLPQETQLIWINIQIMRSSLMVLASLLLLLVLATTAHGIRLDRHLHEALGNKQEQLAGQPQKSNDAADSTGSSKPCTSDGNCSGTAMEQTPHTAIVVKDRDHNQVVASAFARPAVPKFHEDYYGPGGHEPNHH
ncbi:hypothetical protein VPH35_040575 [Triticum aestivum]